jgi:hypothetical protein
MVLGPTLFFAQAPSTTAVRFFCFSGSLLLPVRFFYRLAQIYYHFTGSLLLFFPNPNSTTSSPIPALLHRAAVLGQCEQAYPLP